MKTSCNQTCLFSRWTHWRPSNAAILSVLLTAVSAGLLAGCASQNVNPKQARADVGYVDFTAAGPNDLYWQVSRYDEKKKKFETIYSKLQAPEDGVLRLEFQPGHHRVRVTFLNRVINNPADFDLEVLAGHVTPVKVTLTAAHTTAVISKNARVGPTAYGRYGRSVDIVSDDSLSYGMAASVGVPKAYREKQSETYAHDSYAHDFEQ